MMNQRRLIPSTSMLMAFDAAARTGNFTGAARELNLTQGAISRQIGALEEQLEVALFERSGKTVRLTETGKIYAGQIHSALQLIRNASVNAMSSSLSGNLNLAILPTLGTRWLMPRLPLFLRENPELTVNFVSRLSPFDFRNEDLHSAIHFGLADWPGAECTFLMGEQSVPVCSPRFLQEHQIERCADLAGVPLLHLSTRAGAWADWFSMSGVEPPERKGMLFEQFSIIAQAAAAGLGAALLPEFLIRNEIKQGDLTVLFDTPLQSEAGYYLATPVEKTDYPPVVALRDWLLRMTA